MEHINQLEQAIRSAVPKEWVYEYDYLLSKGHPLAMTMPLMNPFHVVLITIAYLLSIVIGRAIMKNREPFKLRTFSVVHNTFLVLLSTYMCTESLRQAYLSNFRVIWGNAIVEGPAGVPMARVLWVFYISKIIEFVDTWIMILKKNNHQISFLHVYHHTTIFAVSWLIYYFAPGGDGYFTAALNSFIHVVMYSYYLLSSFGISVPWKKYITIGQMTQFVLLFLEAAYMAYYPVPGGYHVYLAYLLLVYMITLLILFMNFYLKNLAKRD